MIEFNSTDEKTAMKYARIEKILGTDDLIGTIKKFYGDIGQPYSVKELNIGKKEYLSRLDEMVEKSIQDSELAFNPVIVGEEDLKNIYKKAYGD